jgi:hypothetical protein
LGRTTFKSHAQDARGRSGIQLPANFGGVLILSVLYSHILVYTTPKRVEYLVVITALGRSIHGRNNGQPRAQYGHAAERRLLTRAQTEVGVVSVSRVVCEVLILL